MKKTLFLITATIALALAGGPSYAADVTNYPAGAAAGGIGNTRHNLGAFGRVLHTNATTGVCVFCHTPHHSNKGGANGLSPLWNRASASPTAFTAYGTTIGGTNVSDADLGGSTLACLSCHDGITTFDNIVNAPGKGGVTAGGADRVWTFFMPDTGLGFSVSGTPLDHFTTGFPCSSCHSGTNLQNNISRLIIGRDLSNDHPVSVPYNEGRASLRPTDTVINTIDLTAGLASSALSYKSGNLAQNRWAVKGFISDTAKISDLLRGGRVECSSCHDPHFNNLSWDEVEVSWTEQPPDNVYWCGNDPESCTDGNFLRRVGGNTGSGVCRTCHEK